MAGKVNEAAADVTGARRAFVAGATGYTGRAVVAELLARGTVTTAHVRPDSPRLGAWHDHFTALGAAVDESAWTAAALEAALARHRPDVVFALLGTTRARGARAPGDSYGTVDYGLTALLLHATFRAAPHARFVYLSSVGVGPRARGAYLRARWRLERELRASGLQWTIARPPIISGPDRAEPRRLERLAALVGDALLATAGALGARRVQDRYRSITGPELARALVRHAFDAGSAGRVLYGDELR
jgi:nucleoside-diphosphate-sugar epimerase